MEVKLVAIKRTPRISKKSGKPFVSVGIKTEQHGDKWLSGFASSENADWGEGHTVQIEVEQKGDFLNFTSPKEEERDRSPAANNGATAEIKNILVLKVIPLLEAIYKQNPPIKKESRYDVAAADEMVENQPW